MSPFFFNIYTQRDGEIVIDVFMYTCVCIYSRLSYRLALSIKGPKGNGNPLAMSTPCTRPWFMIYHPPPKKMLKK